ncbi:MAG TPA: hypothetical protein PLP01_09595 [Phycisphaerae bacterium]|nr:hypothetical protein [Phycisphaerae bacterium]HOI55489.1 hypothetical protein [Phycisphaerae bacterium]
MGGKGRSWAWWLTLVLLSQAGCDDSEARHARLMEQQLREANQRASEAREETRRLWSERERDRRVLVAGEREARADREAALLLWQATAIALLVTLALLAWQVRARRLAERRSGTMQQSEGAQDE